MTLEEAISLNTSYHWEKWTWKRYQKVIIQQNWKISELEAKIEALEGKRQAV
jgi:hypothetical protein